MTKNNRIIKLKLDVIFKAMFGKKGNEKILADFLSRLLEIPRKSIQQIIIENVELLPENFGDKFSRVDLKMQVDKRIVNVELQICGEEHFKERSTYYWAKIFSGELKSGEDYGKLKETICINIVDFKETLIKSRLTAWRTSCLHIFRHIAHKFLDIRQYACEISVQSDKKSDCAICTPDLISASLIYLTARSFTRISRSWRKTVTKY